MSTIIQKRVKKFKGRTNAHRKWVGLEDWIELRANQSWIWRMKIKIWKEKGEFCANTILYIKVKAGTKRRSVEKVAILLFWTARVNMQRYANSHTLFFYFLWKCCIVYIIVFFYNIFSISFRCINYLISH